jgi:hypothetical protein
MGGAMTEYMHVNEAWSRLENLTDDPATRVEVKFDRWCGYYDPILSVTFDYDGESTIDDPFGDADDYYDLTRYGDFFDLVKVDEVTKAEEQIAKARERRSQ